MHAEGYPGSGPGLGSGALNSSGGAEWWKGGSSMVPVSYSRRGLGWNHRLVLSRLSCSPLAAWAVWTGRRGVHLSSGFSLLLCRTRKMGSQAPSSSEKGRRKARSTGKACTQLSSRTCRLPHRPGSVRSLSCCCLSTPWPPCSARTVLLSEPFLHPCPHWLSDFQPPAVFLATRSLTLCLLTSKILGVTWFYSNPRIRSRLSLGCQALLQPSAWVPAHCEDWIFFFSP